MVLNARSSSFLTWPVEQAHATICLVVCNAMQIGEDYTQSMSTDMNYKCSLTQCWIAHFPHDNGSDVVCLTICVALLPMRAINCLLCCCVCGL